MEMEKSNGKIVRGSWSEKEDEILKELVEKKGPKNWNLIATSIPGRTGKSCRLRWCNQLHPSLKQHPFTDEENSIIKEAHAVHGNKWCVIAKLLPGRTDNAIKNHWNATLRKCMKSTPAPAPRLLTCGPGWIEPSSEESPTDGCLDLFKPVEGMDMISTVNQPSALEDMAQTSKISCSLKLNPPGTEDNVNLSRPLQMADLRLSEHQPELLQDKTETFATYSPSITNPVQLQSVHLSAEMNYQPEQLQDISETFATNCPSVNNRVQLHSDHLSEMNQQPEQLQDKSETFASHCPLINNHVQLHSEHLSEMNHETVSRPFAKIGPLNLLSSSTPGALIQGSKLDFGTCKLLGGASGESVIPLHCGHGCCTGYDIGSSRSSLLGPEFVDYEELPSFSSEELNLAAVDLLNAARLKNGIETSEKVNRRGNDQERKVPLCM